MSWRERQACPAPYLRFNFELSWAFRRRSIWQDGACLRPETCCCALNLRRQTSLVGLATDHMQRFLEHSNGNSVCRHLNCATSTRPVHMCGPIPLKNNSPKSRRHISEAILLQQELNEKCFLSSRARPIRRSGKLRAAAESPHPYTSHWRSRSTASSSAERTSAPQNAALCCQFPIRENCTAAPPNAPKVR